ALVALFADTETREDAAEQIVRGHFACNLTERSLREAQLFGKQLAGARLRKGGAPLRDMIAGARDRIQMPPARAERAALGASKTHALLEVLAQQLESRAGFRRYGNLRLLGCLREIRRAAG